MYQQQIQNNAVIRPINTQAATTGKISETALEKTVGVSLLADYNQQLGDIAKSLQENLNTKNNISSEIGTLQRIQTQDTIDVNGEASYKLSDEQASNLSTKYPDLKISQSGGVSYVSKNSLENQISSRQEKLAGLNSTSELVSMQIQSVVDQRKSAVTLLSNLIASRDDTLMNIIRNIKS